MRRIVIVALTLVVSASFFTASAAGKDKKKKKAKTEQTTTLEPVRMMTGGDTLTCRFLQENSFEYFPAFKFVVNKKYLPRVNDQTLFRSGRIMVIPFGQRFVGANQDKTLKAKLAAPLMRPNAPHRVDAANA